jgi:hypothetical protein
MDMAVAKSDNSKALLRLCLCILWYLFSSELAAFEDAAMEFDQGEITGRPLFEAQAHAIASRWHIVANRQKKGLPTIDIRGGGIQYGYRWSGSRGEDVAPLVKGPTG